MNRYYVSWHIDIEAERRLIVAGSPAVAEHTVAAVVRDVRRLLETR